MMRTSWVTHFEGTAVRANDTLPPLDEALLVTDSISYLDDVARHVVVQDLDRLSNRDTPRE
jgi:hypothetical protein